MFNWQFVVAVAVISVCGMILSICKHRASVTIRKLDKDIVMAKIAERKAEREYKECV